MRTGIHSKNPTRSAHIGSAATQNASAPLPRKRSGPAPTGQCWAGGACSRREKRRVAMTRGKPREGNAGTLGTRCGSAVRGAHADCSMLPDDSSVAAHSWFGRSPALCSHLCNCGAAESPMPSATAQKSVAAINARPFSEWQRSSRNVTSGSLPELRTFGKCPFALELRIHRRRRSHALAPHRLSPVGRKVPVKVNVHVQGGLANDANNAAASSP